MRIESKTLFINIIVPVDLGYFKAEPIVNVHVYITKDDEIAVNYEDWYFNDWTFLGVDIKKDALDSKWNEIINALDSIGIPLAENIQCEIDNYFTDEIKQEIIKFSNF